MCFKSITVFAFLILTSLLFVSAQENADKSGKKQKDKKEKKVNKQPSLDLKNPTAEQLGELAILVYGNRENLNQIRKTTFERGKISVVNAEGKTEQANYERWILRADSLEKERVRFDQEFPNAKFALIYNGDKIFGLFNESTFTPREDASKAFENQIWRGLETLLRYKENGSKLELAGREKIMNVEYFLLDVTDKQNRKTRFYISTKSFIVKILEYTENNTKYLRRFYDYRVAQGTLVPYRTVLFANDKQVEETEIKTISFGQKVEENMFQGS
ncbi:MAG: hypothetical protein LC768_16850 [Acidobacteria bacterium]|nr:hypothetical protein [Acidobacteriota bacterium]